MAGNVSESALRAGERSFRAHRVGEGGPLGVGVRGRLELAAVAVEPEIYAIVRGRISGGA